VVSEKICERSCDLLPPNTFRIPTSLLRVTAKAVERLIKFMHAINNISNPIKPSVSNGVLLVT
jgi:hypothetical protein